MKIGFTGFKDPSGREIRNGIFNDNPFDIKLEWLHFYWPDPNGKLMKIKLDGWVIWDEVIGPPIDPPMVDIWSFKGDHTVSADRSEDLEFHFEFDAKDFGYFVEAHFEGIGCPIFDDRY